MSTTRSPIRLLLLAGAIAGFVALLWWLRSGRDHVAEPDPPGPSAAADRGASDRSAPASGAGEQRARPALPENQSRAAGPPGDLSPEEIDELFGINHGEPPSPDDPNAVHAPPREEKAPLSAGEKRERQVRALALMDERIATFEARADEAESTRDGDTAAQLRVQIQRMRQHRERVARESADAD